MTFWQRFFMETATLLLLGGILLLIAQCGS
jgi:hypothetical protein